MKHFPNGSAIRTVVTALALLQFDCARNPDLSRLPPQLIVLPGATQITVGTSGDGASELSYQVDRTVLPPPDNARSYVSAIYLPVAAVNATRQGITAPLQ